MKSITKEFLESEIVSVEYKRGIGTLTHCYITVKSGFVFTGESACVDEDLFNEEIGQKIAYENAFEKMWSHYGFWLKQKRGQNFLYRLENERAELAERLDNLTKFLSSADVIDKTQYDLLNLQKKHMQDYLTVLDMRLEEIYSKARGTK